MKIRGEDALAVAAAKLKRQLPSVWEEFEKAFEAVGAAARDVAIQAPADKVMVAQGRAQQCVAFSELFTKATTIADQIAAKQQK